ncbi:MAG: SPFH domain-containing protein, partial [Planctomycetaceae bacterium]
TAPIENPRWTADANQFAASIQVGDADGFFAKRLVIEPGTRALIIDEGEYLGEVGPGTYTLESFAEKLQFWRKKQATAVLTRQEDFVVELLCEAVPTAEHLTVDATLRLTVQIEDVALFARNLMGSRRQFTAADLRDALAPIVQQALWETIGSFSIADLTGPQVRQTVDAAVEQALGVSMRRYGLRFVGVQTVSIGHEKYDEHRRKLGDAWIQKEDVKLRETLNELESLAENVGIDKQESDVAAELRRIGVRNQMREAVLSEEFDKVTNTEELEKFLQERDKSKLIRQEEIDELKAGYEDRKGDRASARKHLVAKLDLERGFEIERVRSELDHARLLKTRRHEIELAELTATKENAEWQRTLERECLEAEHRRA